MVEGDIRRRTDIPRGDWDVVYHCAASYKDRGEWERDASTNVLGTVNVVREAERSGAKVVYCQTSLCYGPDPYNAREPWPLPHEWPLDLHGSYAVSKTAGEAYIRDSGVPYVSLRLANIYGPRNLSGPVPAFYQRLSQAQPCTVVDSRRDFVFVDDMVWVAIRAATQGAGVYHISSGSDISIRYLYDTVESALGVFSKPTLAPRGPDDVATLLLDPSRTPKDRSPGLWHEEVAGQTFDITHIFRALPGLRVERKHWWVSGIARNGQRHWLWGGDGSYPTLTPTAMPAPYRVEHRCLYRTPEQVLASRAFLNDREAVVEQTGQEDDQPGLPRPVFDYERMPA